MEQNFYYPVLWVLIASLIVGLLLVQRNLGFYTKAISSSPALAAQCGRQVAWLRLLKNVLSVFIVLLTAGGVATAYYDHQIRTQHLTLRRQALWPHFDAQTFWKAPDVFLAETDDEAARIRYGRDLIAHTQDYFGANGALRPNSINHLNCQSCHLEAGSKTFGNNYFAVESTYPQMRARSGSLETIPKRINDCFQRSLNGQPLDTTGSEMKAIMAYMRWLGTGVPKGARPRGSGLMEVPFLQRAADPAKGQIVYMEKCASCHGTDGCGLPIPESARNYPPLWGEKSYNQAAGLFRLSRFAGYVKANMPFGATYDNPQLTDEEAWDVAAFVNSQPRPLHPFLDTDWPNIAKKPFDHPFGPYKDSFPESQHKLGPFEPIIAFYKK